MKKRLRHILSVTLAAVMIFCVSAIGTSAETTTATSGYYTYTVDENGNAIITATDLSISGDVDIPSTIDGYTVTGIGEFAFAYADELTGVTIPDSVTIIGKEAFYSCTSLKSITIPSNVTSIGNAPFAGCSSLTSITVNSLNEYYSSDAYGVLFNKNKTELIQYPAGNTRTNYTIPSGVTSIGASAFAVCTNLTSIAISDSVTSIGDFAFIHCYGLTSIPIPDSVTNIGISAFAYCLSLTRVSIPDGVTSIGTNAFAGCSSLASVSIPDSVTNIGYYAFGECESLTNVTIPDSVISIGPLAFFRCKSLSNVTIPNSVTSIGGNVFCECESLENVTISDSVTNIDCETFCSCTKLTSITIPDSVTNIEAYAFYDCSSLTDVYYTGTEEEWNAITIGVDNDDLINATIHYNYTEEPTTQPEEPTTQPEEPTTQPEEPTTQPEEPTTKPEEPTTKPTSPAPDEPTADKEIIPSPTRSEISYGDAIVLHVDKTKIPEGGYVVWTADNDNFSYTVADDGTCTITPESSGDTTFTATVYDAEGNAVSTDEQTMTSKAGFFQKLIAFFKKLFNLTKVYPNFIAD